MTERTPDLHHVQADDLGTVLTLLRTAGGLSQTELAEASGISSATISEYENSKMTPRSTMLKNILDALGLPWAALDLTQGYLQSLRSSNERLAGPTASLSALELAFDTEALGQEIEQVLVLGEKAFSRMLRLWLVPIFQGSVRLTRQQLLDILEVEETSR